MMGQMIYLKDVVTIGLDQEKCSGCGMCTLVCPQAVLSLGNGKALIQNRDACIECGACSTNCPQEAISVETGVGCAAAVIKSLLKGNKAPLCCGPDAPDASPEGEGEKPSCC